MLAQTITLQVKALTSNGAEQIKTSLQTIADNIDPDALSILAEKSKKKGMSDKVRKFKNMM